MKILFIMSRDYAKEPFSGRKVIINNYFNYLKNKEHKIISMKSIFNKINFRTFLFHIISIMKNILFFNKYPIQMQIYNNSHNLNLIKNECFTFKPDLIFVDGIRLKLLIENAVWLQNRSKILDMDDLLSRRYNYYISKSQNITFGIYGRKYSLLSNLIPKFIGRRILKSESKKILIQEKESVNYFNKIIFSSNAEKDYYNTFYNLNNKNFLFSQIFPIDPVNKISKKNKSNIINFMFIGSDMVLQNKLTIKFLIDIWNRFEIKHNLNIIGKMNGKYDYNDKVLFLGYVDDIEECYLDMDALLSPSFIEGGLKTKVLESYKYYLPVIGNKITFEGLSIDENYPFLVNDGDYGDFLNMNSEEFNSKKNDCVIYIKKILELHSKENYNKMMDSLLQ